MTRYMYDATHVNVSTIPTDAAVIAGYDTGTAEIKWTEDDWAAFPNAQHVHVDQGAEGAPVRTATVMDVEPRAYTVNDIPDWENKCTAVRPTAYVNGSELREALAATDHEIWLADPGISDEEALAKMAANPRIVAIQNLWTNTFDRSVIGDPTWPAAKKVPVTSPPTPTPVTTPTAGPSAVGNLRGTPLAIIAAINMAWDAQPGTDPYEWQMERDTDKGWVVEQQGKTTATVASVHNLSPNQNYRFRVSNGTWSEWITVTTP
jgi:hypothetical protein